MSQQSTRMEVASVHEAAATPANTGKRRYPLSNPPTSDELDALCAALQDNANHAFAHFGFQLANAVTPNNSTVTTLGQRVKLPILESA